MWCEMALGDLFNEVLGLIVILRSLRQFSSNGRVDLVGDFSFGDLLSSSLQLTRRAEKCEVGVDLIGKIGDPFAGLCGATNDRGRPVVVRTHREVEHGAETSKQVSGTRLIGFVDGKNIGEFKETSLEELDAVSGSGDLNECESVNYMGYVYFLLTDADGLHDDYIETSRIKEMDDTRGCWSESAGATTRGHAPDEDIGVFLSIEHANAIAKCRSAG
jgi:hypothetical protein